MSRRKKPKNLAEGFDQFKADYEATKHTRFVRRRTGLAPQGGGADYHFRNEASYYELIEKARDMERNDSVVGQIIQRSALNIVQDGFTLDIRTGDGKLDLDLWEMWQDFATEPELCDIAGEMSFHDYEMQAVQAMQRDGDGVITGTTDGPLQFFESHTIQDNTSRANTFLGVEMDEHRRRLRYYYQADPVDPKRGRKADPVPLDVRDEDNIRQLFHVYDPRRATLTRGVTALAPVFALAGMFEDVQFATLLQRQICSFFAIFRQRQALGGTAPPSTNAGYGDRSTEISASGETRYLEGIAPGAEIIGEPGEELKAFSPDIPGGQFFEHTKLILQLIGVNLGLPLCLVLMDGSETNFSGWRGAVDEARKGFKHHQKNLIKRFHAPVYKWWLDKKRAGDPVLRRMHETTGIDLFGHKWNAPSWPYIEPVNDAAGDLLRVRNALISPRRLHAERGRDWEEIAEESVSDNAYAIIRAKRTAMEINRRFDDGQPVHWRDLISLPTPDGVTVSASSSQPSQAPSQMPPVTKEANVAA